MLVIYFIILIIIIISFLLISNKRESFENNNSRKVAFCFLIYDVINHEELWNNFFKNVDKNKYNIYIHYKVDIPLKYFNEYKIKNIMKTEWCGISLVQAQNLLLKVGL